MKNKLETKSLSLGFLFGIIALVAFGAARTESVIKEINPVRFLVLEVTPKGEPTGIGQPVLLRLSPHYGKISKEGLDFRIKNETQELTLVTCVEKGYEIRRGDILGFQVSQHLKLSPGSAVYRHFPSGGGESVK